MTLTITNKDVIDQILGTLRKKPKTPVESIRIYTKGDMEWSQFDFKFVNQSRHTNHWFIIDAFLTEKILCLKVYNVKTNKQADIKLLAI